MGSSPPDGGEQTLPHSVSPITVVVQEVLPPLTGQDLSENDFILIKPVPPEIKVSSLKSAMFYLPDAKIFMDKCLPDLEPCFMERIVPHSRFSPTTLLASIILLVHLARTILKVHSITLGRG